MVLSMDLVYGQDTHPFVMALDYRKAIDSVDQDIAVAVLRELRVHAPIVDLLSDQWSSHKRWCTIGGAVAPQPIEGALGIPQGDVWSPILATVLSAPAKETAAREPSRLSIPGRQNHTRSDL